jgi:hypothetical protein
VLRSSWPDLPPGLIAGLSSFAVLESTSVTLSSSCLELMRIG